MSLVENAGLFVFQTDCVMKSVVIGVPLVLVLATPVLESIIWMDWPNFWYLVSPSKMDLLRASIDDDALMIIWCNLSCCVSKRGHNDASSNALHNFFIASLGIHWNCIEFCLPADRMLPFKLGAHEGCELLAVDLCASFFLVVSDGLLIIQVFLTSLVLPTM